MFLLWVCFFYLPTSLIYIGYHIWFNTQKKIIEVSDREANEIPDFKLPTVSILLPVYREEIILPYLLHSITKMNYPVSKLDIRILVELEDHKTLRSILSIPIQAGKTNGVKYDKYGFPKSIKIWRDAIVNIDYIYIHSKGAKTKPNALNMGLANAKGSIVTIYDAEDRPETNQLRKAVAYMLNHPEVACVQARLAYYNSDQSLLTKLFAIEYIQHFLLYLPLFHALQKVILLGGTSNYFRMEVIRRLDGWDYANVTEDADLGVRLGKLGFKIIPINTITWEEAPPKLYPWIKQRSRWNKGYLQTLFHHFKAPHKLLKEIGFSSTVFLIFQLTSPFVFAISIPGLILFFVYWIDWVGIASLDPLSDMIYESFKENSIAFYITLFTFTFGALYSPFMAIEALFRQGDAYSLKLIKYAFLFPFYAAFQSISSLMAIYEMILRPKVWHKTHHGFSIDPNNNPGK